MQERNEQMQREAQILQEVLQTVQQVIVGQSRLVNRLMIALLCNGHVLIEGVPGLAKTLTVRTLADTIQAEFRRIQFTPDLLPADLIGTQIYNPRNGDFSARKGPIFTNIVLADEINRAPAKVQSALLEAMEERQVTLGDETHILADPFMVLATQNPLEQEGTYPLPEAQLDRFMLKVLVNYPTRDEERMIIDRMTGMPPQSPEAVMALDNIRRLRQIVSDIYVDDRLKDYVLDIVFATRSPEGSLAGLKSYIEVGASPRATIALIQAAKAYAFLRGRAFVTPDDVKSLALETLRHRIVLSFEAEAENITPDRVISQILSKLDVPR
jgi:MoxR-like ATPase